MKVLGIAVVLIILFPTNVVFGESYYSLTNLFQDSSELRTAIIEEMDKDTYSFNHEMELSEEYAAVIQRRLIDGEIAVEELTINDTKCIVKFKTDSSYEQRVAFMKKATKVFLFDTLKLKENE